MSAQHETPETGLYCLLCGQKIHGIATHFVNFHNLVVTSPVMIDGKWLPADKQGELERYVI